MGLGSVTAGGRHFDITRLRLRGGLLVIEAEGAGQLPDVRTGVTVYGEDGHGFACDGDSVDAASAARGRVRIAFSLPLSAAGPPPRSCCHSHSAEARAAV